jgi:hypothetical protein
MDGENEAKPEPASEDRRCQETFQFGIDEVRQRHGLSALRTCEEGEQA